jgi:hypothetical protein
MDDAQVGFDVDTHLARLHRDGYSIIENFLDGTGLEAVRHGLAPHLGRYVGRNNFEGHKTERVYTLVARGAVFEHIVEDPRILTYATVYCSRGTCSPPAKRSASTLARHRSRFTAMIPSTQFRDHDRP